MWLNFLFTYLHYLSIIVVIATVFTEVFLVRKNISANRLKTIVKVDGIYGFSSIAVVATGLIRVYNYGKGSDYYFSNSIFIIKFSLFILVGILSIYPTVTFLKLRKANKNNENQNVEIHKYSLISILIKLELIILLMIPFLAILMANGQDIN